MKKHHYIVLAIVLVGLAVSASFFLFPRQLPLEECSAEFLCYKDVDGIDASFIKDFPVNDTLRLDVTTLQATDSAGWERLKRDFHIATLADHTQYRIDSLGKDIVSVKLVPKRDPTLPMDTTRLLNNNVLAVSRLHRTISIFRVSTESEMNAIRKNQFEIGISNL